jgi:hypothetical protein
METKCTPDFADGGHVFFPIYDGGHVFFPFSPLFSTFWPYLLLCYSHQTAKSNLALFMLVLLMFLLSNR